MKRSPFIIGLLLAAILATAMYIGDCSPTEWLEIPERGVRLG